MKTIKKYFLALGMATVLGFGFGSCTDDLDLMPRDPSAVSPGDFASDPEGYMNRVLADVYLLFATQGANGDAPIQDYDGGMATFQRAIFTAEEIPTDEASWLWDNDKYGTLKYGYLNASTSSLMGLYYRLMINITLCNDFIQTVESGRFGLSADLASTADEYLRQAKILRSACYFYYINFFGDVPYADENTPIGAVPPRMKRAEAFNLVTATLEEIVDYYKANDPNQKPKYGFVGLDVAESLLVKFYLNAEVFAGQSMYDKCLTHANAVIARLGNGGPHNNGLANKYWQLFGANNAQYAIGGSSDINEIIWTIPQDEVHLTSWANSTFMIVAWIGTNGVEVALKEPKREDYASEEEYKEALKKYQEDTKEDNAWKKNINYTFNKVDYAFNPKEKGHVASSWFNSSGGWKCMVARKSFVKKFEWDDAAMSISKDDRVKYWCTSAHGFTVDNKNLEGASWGENGYLAPKFTNWAYDANGDIDNNASGTPREQVGGDYPVIRLAEIYLSAAEAILNGGGGSQADALKYVNYIRERAGLDPFTTLTTDNLRDERCRELYQENTRRTDLIRYGQWCFGYTWDWKGGTEIGRDLPEYTKLYPLPNDIIVASGYEQNPGY